jgi:2-iminoacetate synthase
LSFYEICREWQRMDDSVGLREVSERDVSRILQKDRLNEQDFLSLLSPAAGRCLEAMAQRAHRLTVQHFGRTILLFAPLYVSDYCVNSCSYCSFSVEHDFLRKKLSLHEVEKEGAALAATGIKHLLLLTGESPRLAGFEYLKDCIRVLSMQFASVSLEVQPLEREQYADLIASGADGLTLYQETYDEELYRELHRKGPKRNYLYRLNAPERACQAGVRTVTIGPLLGLDNWRREVFLAGMHARYLHARYPVTELGVSFPRIRPHLGGWNPAHLVDDKALVQAMLAMRLFLPRAGITLSTRECGELRNRLLRLGVTKMSAGSSTAVGGYAHEMAGNKQFETADERSVEEIRAYLQSQGYQPVLADWPHFAARTRSDSTASTASIQS